MEDFEIRIGSEHQRFERYRRKGAVVTRTLFKIR